jgi:hypothetical protein
MNKFSRTVLAAGALSAAMGLAPVIASADTGAADAHASVKGGFHIGWGFGSEGRADRKLAVFGTVQSVSGTTLTVTQKGFMRPGPKPENANDASAPAATVYTVDASNATVYKGNATSTVSAIATGDVVMVEGAVNGTSVTANVIRDGFPQMKPVAPKPVPVIKGNGQPVVGGSVTAISGSTVSITNSSNVSFTIDASNATVAKGNAASTVSDIAVGDTLIVQGAVNGSSITASSIIDSSAKAAGTGDGNGKEHGVFGFFAGIGGFFAHLFGF